METKTCKQCGEIKPLEQFRKYYGGRKGTYTICRSCEKINSRAKYIEKKGQAATSAELSELDKIYKLYDAQRACGLQPPRRSEGRRTSLVEDLDSMIEMYTKKANVAPESLSTFDTEATPPELLQWLSAELTEEPDYYIDEVYEGLLEKYRPTLRIDQDSMLPVYDCTHAQALDSILDRFNKYEDDYYSKED